LAAAQGQQVREDRRLVVVAQADGEAGHAERGLVVGRKRDGCAQFMGRRRRFRLHDPAEELDRAAVAHHPLGRAVGVENGPGPIGEHHPAFERIERLGHPAQRAIDSISAAVFTASPQTSKVNLFFPTTPDITGPECSPIRMPSAGNRIFSQEIC
jgi:hypothetical protein